MKNVVDGKWLREGKRSDNQLPASGSLTLDCGDQTANTVSYAKLHKIVPSFTNDFVEKQIPLDPALELSEDVSLDAKDLIRAFTNESDGKASSFKFDSLAGVDDRIIDRF